MTHKHRFERLSDVAIFCECGEIREAPVVPAGYYPPLYVPPVCTRPHYPPYPVYPYTPSLPTYPIWIVTSQADTVTRGVVDVSGNASMPSDVQVTYTA